VVAVRDECWQAVYTTPLVNDALEFRANAD
jgi:hypothetical protein